MKIITNDNILLEHNIISIFTNIEKFLDQLETCERDGLIEVSQKEKTNLKNMLVLSDKNNKATFFGLFYSVDPFSTDIDYCWSILKTKKEYGLLLDAIRNGDLFAMSYGKENFYKDLEDTECVEIGNNNFYDFADDEEDEYDDDEELEFELDDYLEEDYDEEN